MKLHLDNSGGKKKKRKLEQQNRNIDLFNICVGMKKVSSLGTWIIYFT